MREIILGIIQGLTEFLPVSSSGHLALVQYFYRGLDDTDLLLDILLHLGTLFVVIIYYRQEIVDICRAVLSYIPFLRPILLKNGETANETEKLRLLQARKMIPLIILGSVPTAMIGFFLKSIIEESFASLTVIGIALIITGTLLYLADTVKLSSPPRKSLSYKDALLIGTVQGIAVFPGISRSGSTISTGIFLGIERKLAAKFSFLLSIPAIVGAVILEGKDLATLSCQLLPYILATIVAFITGYFAITALIKVVVQKKLSWFSWYCWLVGGIACIVSVVM